MSLSAQNNASCDAFIHNVPESVGETAFHAYNLAIGNVFTWEIVQCHAEHHVIDFPVMSVVLSFLNVGIDVLLYVAKFVPQVAFAKYAVVEGKNWWDLLNSARSIWTKIQLLCFHANISTQEVILTRCSRFAKHTFVTKMVSISRVSKWDVCGFSLSSVRNVRCRSQTSIGTIIISNALYWTIY